VIWLWTGFVVFVLLMLALDLGVFHRKAHVVTVKEALGWSALQPIHSWFSRVTSLPSSDSGRSISHWRACSTSSDTSNCRSRWC